MAGENTTEDTALTASRVFGGIEANTGKSFFIPVADRKESTLIPIVKDWIKPGSIIRSDGWAGYQCLQAEGYTHEVVNHSVASKTLRLVPTQLQLSPPGGT